MPQPRPSDPASGEITAGPAAAPDPDSDPARMLELLSRASAIARAGAWRIDLATRAVDWSDEMFAIFGVERGAAGFDASATFVAAVLPEDRAAFDAARDGALSEGIPRVTELRIARPDGSIRWVHAEGEPERDGDGRAVALVGFAQDITDRKLADAALRESEMRFRSALDATRDEICIVRAIRDRTGTVVDFEILWANRAWLAENSRDGAGIIGARIYEAVPEIVERRAIHLRVVESGVEEDVLARIGGRWRELHLSPYLDGFMAISRDVTERIAAEHARQASEELVATLVAVSPDAIIVHEAGAIVFANQAAATLAGAQTPDELVGRQMIDFVHPDDRPLIISRVGTMLTQGVAAPRTEERFLRLDGTTFDVETAAAPMFGGDRPRILVLAHDITERKRLDKAVQETAERLARAQRAAGVGLWDWDVASGQVDWSPELHTLFGLDPALAPVSFDTWNRLVHPDDLEESTAAMTNAVAARIPLSSEYRIVRPDGETRWIHVLGSTAYDDLGQAQKMAGICLDITERKQAEESLRDSNQFIRQVIDSAHEGIVVYGPDLRYQVFNPFMEALSGFRASDMLGKHPAEVLPFLVSVGVIDRLRLALTGVIPDPVEFPFDTNGRKGWTIDSSAPLRNEAGEVIGVIATVQDSTSRRQAEATLRESELLLRESQRAASVGSYRADFVAGRWQSSEVLDQLFGIDSGYVRDIPGWLDIIHPDDRSTMEGYLNDEVLGRGAPFSREYRIVRRSDGEVRWVNGLGETGLDASGRAVSLVGTIQDITDRKAAEEERERLQDQLQQAQKLESVGRLAGGVAHDFNNMLGAILGYTELALEKVDPTDALHADLEEVRKAAERSADLTSRLLAFARRAARAPRVVDLNETVEGLLRMLRRLIGEDVDLVWRPGAATWPVMVDPSQVDQILTNLCVNARDAIAGVGSITIESGRASFDEAWCADHAGYLAGEFTELAVTDDGQGMDADTLAHIFEPFFTTKAVGEGTGLGLAVVYGIVSQNDGFITVSSEPGRGATFRIFLRRHLGKAERSGPERARGAADSGHETILLVEDEETLLVLGKAMLERLGYRVLAAGTPGEAIRLAERHVGEIDLLMTDVVMPEMNGRDLARRLLALYPDLRRLFVSGYPASIIASDGVLDEGVKFLQKPFSLQALSEELRAVLDP